MDVRHSTRRRRIGLKNMRHSHLRLEWGRGILKSLSVHACPDAVENLSAGACRLFFALVRRAIPCIGVIPISGNILAAPGKNRPEVVLRTTELTRLQAAGERTLDGSQSCASGLLSGARIT